MDVSVRLRVVDSFRGYDTVLSWSKLKVYPIFEVNMQACDNGAGGSQSVIEQMIIWSLNDRMHMSDLQYGE
jgi:hypothetical protein